MAKVIRKHSKFALVLGLGMALVASYVLIPESQGAILANREVRLFDSRPSTSTTYDFEADHTASNAKCINVQFCTTASGTCTPAGTTLSATAKSSSGWAGWTQANWTLATAADILALTYATGETPSPITNASFSIDAITNPASAGTKYAWIETTDSVTNCNTSDPGGTTIDTGVVAFAIIEGVTVSVTVSESLTSAVYAVTSGSCTVSGGTNITSTATTVPFGTIVVDTFYNSCQDVRVATNANSGYTTRVFKTAALTCTSAGQCGSNTIADGTCDGSCSTSTEESWASSEYNGFGYCMDDTVGTAASTADTGWATYYCGASPQYFKTTGTAAANAVAIMSSAGAASNDRANIGFRITVDAAQPAGPYSTTIVYTTTPTY
ncbi:MAG: hypothetical protein COT34_00195 [Candidatus Nealsonbacteria bacterium CG08_land_8_20_14_0_20_43_11]|uniref:Uncharacterized protein n=1 Tax=Candidatus Nealsonbacteria bacterium CG08_land_8_20_14_0_20_43_11 TaxID=1974706 RepID=A0A2M6T192_9BACT|nr:MAG: hypothetical protein COT34_00195 [Candidatus Nealsonbacteria bacterium CG08_land_8_20_14_0_20_43_11]